MGTSMKVTLAAVQVVLLTVSIGSVLVFGLWVLGPNGAGVIQGYMLPAALMYAPMNAAAPSVLAHFDGPVFGPMLSVAQDAIGGRVNVASVGDGEFCCVQATFSLFGATPGQSAAWVALQSAPALILALMSWLLYRIVKVVRKGEEFSRGVAGRISLMGLLLLVGMPVLQYLQWLQADRLLEGSAASGVASVPGLDVELWPVVTGVALLILGLAWRGAVELRKDLEGVV